MKRDFSRLDGYLDELQKDIYPQPLDNLHAQWMLDFIKWIWEHDYTKEIQEVLDVGSGQGDAQTFLCEFGVNTYQGVTLGDDVSIAQIKNKNVNRADFTFLPFEDKMADMVFSRHSLEHSPMPVITLMEWLRVSKKYLAIVLPNPEFWTYVGLNHYSVMPDEQVQFLLKRTGWKVLDTKFDDKELWYLCRKHTDEDTQEEIRIKKEEDDRHEKERLYAEEVERKKKEDEEKRQKELVEQEERNQELIRQGLKYEN
jgi:ubiquinone/menaquinone biosynthesis C-methylase UbiE